jgi:Flp pilus assembly protein TadD
MLRFTPKMTALFLCAPLMAGCASTNDIAKLTGGDTAAGHAQKEVAAAKTDQTIPTDLDSGIRQAQLLRQAGQYDDAIHLLSQMMLVASDDPRVVGEYGKSLAQKGRAQDAVDFLNRAIELSSNDWTLYSAVGVAYDQLGNQLAARAAYEHALALRPNEPSVLNNYALSRMLANDPNSARQLIARAEAAGGASDSKIAANIALLNRLNPQDSAKSAEASMPVTPAAPVTATALPAPSQAVTPNVSSQPAPAKVPQTGSTPQPAPSTPTAAAQSQPQKVASAPTPAPAPVRPSGVVMQPVPFDPHAGPVKTATVPAAPTPPSAPAVPAPAVPAKAAVASLVPPKIVIADAPKQPAAKPASVSQPTSTTQPVNLANAALVPPKIVIADDPKPTDKPIPVKATSKDDVPALRLTADARSP